MAELKYNLDDCVLVHFINVGFGDCILIQAPLIKKTILIDIRSDIVDKPIETTGQSYVGNYLRSISVDHLDLIIVTHPHDDHFNGMTRIINRFQSGDKNIWITPYDPSEKYA